MPHINLIERKKYHREYYLKFKDSQIENIKILRKQYPWLYIYRTIKQRCTNPNASDYQYYGGRGIKCLISIDEIKELWFRDKAYLLNQPSIDREDNDGNYEVTNCKFIEMTDNIIKMNRIRKRKQILQFDLKNNFLKEWNSISEASNYYNCHVSTISQNLRLVNQSACGYIWRYK